MATHSSILAWRIPWTAEPGGLWSVESQQIVPINEKAFDLYPVMLQEAQTTSDNSLSIPRNPCVRAC